MTLYYEFTTIPTSLFKDYAMCKTAKAQLAKALISYVQPPEHNTQHLVMGNHPAEKNLKKYNRYPL